MGVISTIFFNTGIIPGVVYALGAANFIILLPLVNASSSNIRIVIFATVAFGIFRGKIISYLYFLSFIARISYFLYFSEIATPFSLKLWVRFWNSFFIIGLPGYLNIAAGIRLSLSSIKLSV